MVNKNDYFAMRERKCEEKIYEILKDDLPDFCREYFIGTNTKTAPLTRLNYAYDLRTFFDYLLNVSEKFDYKSFKDFKVNDLEELSTYDLELYLNYLTNYCTADGKMLTNKAKGKARKLSAVRSMYRYFFKKNALEKDISAIVSTPKIHDKEIVRLERNEINELLDVVATGNGLSTHQQSFFKKTKLRDMAIVALFLGTGIRVSELVGLNVADFDFNNNSFVVTRKGGNRVILYINEEIKQFVEEYFDERKSDLSVPAGEKALFLSKNHTRISTRSVENLVKKYSKIATPLKTISPHKLRSTFGTELYRSTGDIYVVADVLGHKDVNTTKKHYAAITEDVRKNASKFVKLYTDDTEK